MGGLEMQVAPVRAAWRLHPPRAETEVLAMKPAPLMFAAIVIAIFVVFLLALMFWNQIFPDARPGTM